MSEVTVTNQNGASLTALDDPIFIIRIPVPGQDDTFIVTKAIWGYQNSNDPVFKAGWDAIKAKFADRVVAGSDLFIAVRAPDVQGLVNENNVQTNPPAAL
jgi:hypothetical protein